MRRLANRRVGSVSQVISLCSVVSVILGRFRSGFRSGTHLSAQCRPSTGTGTVLRNQPSYPTTIAVAAPGCLFSFDLFLAADTSSLRARAILPRMDATVIIMVAQVELRKHQWDAEGQEGK
jgi:hypothetical protein